MVLALPTAETNKARVFSTLALLIMSLLKSKPTMWPSLLMRVTDRLALGARFFGQLFRTKETEGRTGDLEIALHAARLAEAHHDGFNVFAGHFVFRFARTGFQCYVERPELSEPH